MKNRMRKKNLDWRCKLPRQFVKDTLRALAEARAGKLTPYKYGPGTLNKITLFLDFDGVLHPFLARSSAEAFCHLPRLERVLREFPAVQIVIASTQREAVPLAHLAQQFSPNIAARIVGITPILEVRDAGDVAGSRHREILAYLRGSNADWLALDDDASLFPSGCAELVLCDDGFRDAEERALRTALG